jgi:hypothetical protein
MKANHLGVQGLVEGISRSLTLHGNKVQLFDHFERLELSVVSPSFNGQVVIFLSHLALADRHFSNHRYFPRPAETGS